MGVDFADILLENSSVWQFGKTGLLMGIILLLLSEIAAWLAENGPVSVALNAFAMQVSTFIPATVNSSNTTMSRSTQFELQAVIMPMEIVVIVYSVVLQEGCVSPFEDLLQPLDDRPCRAACGIWRT